jgi:hypothetical protein
VIAATGEQDMNIRNASSTHSSRVARGGPATWHDRRPAVLVEWQGAARAADLRVTEDDLGYSVMLESADVPAQAFEVEADDRRVYIMLAAAPGRLRPARCCMVLAFDETIDASASCGECADGLLHLSLSKTAAVLGGGVATASARALSSAPAYQDGGFGKEQVDAMQRRLDLYDLRLTFSAGKHNAYAADLKLRITDGSGRQVFALDHAGPLTDVNLPPGRYQVVADFGGVRRSGSVDVKPGAPAALSLHWPKDET